MNDISPNPILEFNASQMMEVRKLFCYDDLNRLRQDIQILDNWIKKQQHFVVKQYDERHLELHLVWSKGSIERAKKQIDKLCTFRGLMPEYLQNFDINNEFNNFLNISHTCVFPKPTPDNYRIIFSNYYNPDSRIYELGDMLKYILLIIEYLRQHDYNAGMEVVIDTSNITLGIISKLSPMVITKGFMIIIEGIGLRVKALHFLSGSKFLDTVMAIVKRGLSKKLMSRLHIHESYEAMFKYIPKDIMPKDLGGDMPITVKDVSERNFREFSSPEFIQTMKRIESAGTDESKRLSCKFNEDYSGMPGSFKVLTVD